jgi:aspartyl-tRNA(Asn)/glutamyl-tRNA(Gln) amidotransferase subunit A
LADLDLIYRSAVDLARMIRQREISPVELIDAELSRIEQCRPAINAFITVTADHARAEAKAAERAIAAGAQLGPLHGLPLAVKDMIQTRGVRTTMGSPIFESVVPGEDATPVANAKAAGAILIGKTTTPEFGHKPLTDGPLFGRTHNPWDTSRTTGGSSGGSGAAVVHGMAPLAFGTDGGGSVRIPASCCGVVGLKATLGRIAHVHAADTFGNNSYIGPMTRTVADNRLLFEAMQGGDPRDVHSLFPFPDLPRLEGASLKGVRIGWMARVGNAHIDRETLELCEAGVRLLEGMGAAVEPVEHDFASLERMFLIILQSGLSSRLARYLPEFGSRIDPSLRATIERGNAWSAIDLQEAQAVRTNLFRQAQEDFGKHDFLVSPTLAAPPLAVDHDAFAPVIIEGQEAGQVRGAWYPYTWPYNLTGHPALSLPSGWTRAGLPVGLQLVGPFASEQRLLDLAALLEAAQPWSGRHPPEPR